MNLNVRFVYRALMPEGLLAILLPALKVMIVGISMRKCNSGVWVGFRVFQMCSAIEIASAAGRVFVLEIAPRGLGRAEFNVDVDAV